MRAKPLFVVLLALIITNIFCSCGSPPELRPGRLSPSEKIVSMEVTAYCPCQKCCGWRHMCWCCLMPPVYAYGPNEGKLKKIGICSDGTKARHGAIAADAKLFPFGTKIYIPGYGWGVVHDRGSAITGYHIDIFFEDHDDAEEWGRKRLKVLVVQ